MGERGLVVYDVKNLKRKDRRAVYRTDVAVARLLCAKEQKTLKEWDETPESEPTKIMQMEGALNTVRDLWNEYRELRECTVKELMDGYSLEYWEKHVQERSPTELGSYKDYEEHL